MEPIAPSSQSVSSSDAPQDDSARTIPNNIAVLLHATRILLDYGRHLIATVRRRTTAPNFNAIAACFGTADLNRGILRAAALERVLLARAATGRDIDFVQRRPATPSAQLAQADTPRDRMRIPSRPKGWNDPELFMPTLEDLERQVRRRPFGRTMLDICLDLAVVPGFCHSQFWNELFEIMTCFGGSVPRLMHQKTRRREAFANEQDRKPDANWDWLNMTRDALRQVLGFFIGEPPVNPLGCDAAIATVPP